jgi:hypothetical protein
MAKQRQHTTTEMTVVTSWWKGSSARRGGAHIRLYVCGRCGRETRQITNFIGRRMVVCFGDHVRKVTREDWDHWYAPGRDPNVPGRGVA